MSFRCGEFELVADELETDIDSTPVTASRLKDIFCDAERVLKHDGETWYVGYRKRSGRGGHNQAGLHTRFRSENGEVRYAKGMLHFRHMPSDALSEQLEAASVTARASRS